MRFRSTITVLILAAGLLTGFMARSLTAGKAVPHQVLTSCTGNFSGTNDRNYIALFSPVKGSVDGNYIEIYRFDGNSMKMLWISPPSPIRNIELADVNGDSVDELAITLYKLEPKDPQKDNRLHIYSWHNGEICALWRGTFLSKPFEVLTFGNVTGDEAQELVTVEHGRQQRDHYYLCVYSWNGFGFDLVTETNLEKKPRGVSILSKKNAKYGEIEISNYMAGTRYSVNGSMLERKEAVQ